MSTPRALLTVAVSALLSSTAAAQAEEAASCSACTREGGSWQAGKCWAKDFPLLQPCPLADAPGVCCTTPECCVTAGCRNPEQNWTVSGWMPQLSCQRCCTQGPQGCEYKGWTGTPESQVQPWYNSRGIKDGQNCTEAFGADVCPPCAQCDTRTEEEFLRLTRPEGCVCTKRAPQPDACFMRGSCDCYCQKLARGLSQCPHLGSWPAASDVSTTARVALLHP